jgi:hypothetical protein
MSNIVDEIIVKGKEVIADILPLYAELDYSFVLEANECRGKSHRYGFTPAQAVFVEGRQLGFTTLDHTFIITLVDSYSNRDDDAAQRSALSGLYTDMQKLISAFNKKPFTLPSPENKILLVSGASMDAPEFIDDNAVAVLRASINIRYYYKI